jgi:hypothetical protein
MRGQLDAQEVLEDRVTRKNELVHGRIKNVTYDMRRV